MSSAGGAQLFFQIDRQTHLSVCLNRNWPSIYHSNLVLLLFTTLWLEMVYDLALNQTISFLFAPKVELWASGLPLESTDLQPQAALAVCLATLTEQL